MNVAARFLDALLCGWVAARARWRAFPAPPEVPRKRMCTFDCDDPNTLALTRATDAEAREWYARHFRSGWPRQ